MDFENFEDFEIDDDDGFEVDDTDNNDGFEVDDNKTDNNDTDNNGDAGPENLLEPLNYSSEYVSLAVELINRGVIGYAKARVPAVPFDQRALNFNDLLQSKELLQKCFLSRAHSRSLELTLKDRPPLECLQVALRDGRHGPYGLCLWINIRDHPSHYIFPVVQGPHSPHGLHHELVGFIFEDADAYGGVVRRNSSSWTRAASGGGFVDSSHAETMNLLSERRVHSLLYIVTQHELFLPTKVMRPSYTSATRNITRFVWEKLVRLDLVDVPQSEVTPKRAPTDVVRFNRAQIVAGELLGLEVTKHVSFTPEQVATLKEKIGQCAVVLSPLSTLRCKNWRFTVGTKRPNDIELDRKLCERCFAFSDKRFCFKHLPDDGSDGEYKVYFFSNTPFRRECFSLGWTAGGPIRRSRGFEHITQQWSLRTLEETDRAYFTASVLLFLRNTLRGFELPPRATLFPRRKNTMTCEPSPLTDRIVSFLGLRVQLGPETEFVHTMEQTASMAVIFPPPYKFNMSHPLVYTRVHENNSNSNLIYVGKSSLGNRSYVCCDSTRLPGHIANTVIVQTTAKNLLNTLESASQAAYALASIFGLTLYGKKIILRNKYLENFRVLSENTTYMQYVQTIFHKEFGRTLLIEFV